MDNKKYLIDKYSNGKKVKHPNFRQSFTFEELVELLDSYQTEQLLLSGVKNSYSFENMKSAYEEGIYEGALREKHRNKNNDGFIHSDLEYYMKSWD
ncbi:MAG: putative SAM-dependent methyltransferase [Polaribacter sp.]|jgi:predicted SAM-dependent methyltransferase